MPYVLSKLANTQIYTQYAKDVTNNINIVKAQVTIKGGADITDKNLITPDGVVTNVTRDQLEIALKKVNLFLETYGMNQLDPGNPFDCLILYAMAAEYGTEFLSDKFSAALEVLFSRITDK